MDAIYETIHLCSKSNEKISYFFSCYILILHLIVVILLGKQYLVVIFPFSSPLYDILHRLFTCILQFTYALFL